MEQATSISQDAEEGEAASSGADAMFNSTSSTIPAIVTESEEEGGNLSNDVSSGSLVATLEEENADLSNIGSGNSPATSSVESEEGSADLSNDVRSDISAETSSKGEVKDSAPTPQKEEACGEKTKHVTIAALPPSAESTPENDGEPEVETARRGRRRQHQRGNDDDDGVVDESLIRSRRAYELHQMRSSVGLFMEVVGEEYSHPGRFWAGAVLSSLVQGCLIGCLAYGFFEAFENLLSATWYDTEYEEALKAIEDGTPIPEGALDLTVLGTGKWMWVYMLAVGGAAVGFVKVAWDIFVVPYFDFVMPFPHRVPGFVEELGHLRAHDPITSIPVIACAILSIGFGAGVGPEAPMGAMGTAVGTVLPQIYSKFSWTRYLNIKWEAEMCVLDGKGAGFAVTFPSQFLGPLIIHEVGKHWGTKGRPGKFDFMETVTRTGIAASVSAAVFISLGGLTFLESLVFDRENLDGFEISYLLYGVVAGILCGVFGLLGQVLLIGGDVAGRWVTRKFNVLGDKIFCCCVGRRDTEVDEDKEPRFRLGALLAPAIGGALIGLIYVACPLAIGDGAQQLHAVASDNTDFHFGVLVCTCFASMVTLSIAQGFGFIGGQIFPFMFAGATFGAAIWDRYHPGLPKTVVVAMCMAALPCAFIPALFSFTVIASLIYGLTGPETTPVFICAGVSYALVTGTGLLKTVMIREIANIERKPAASIKNVVEMIKDEDDLSEFTI